MRLTNDDPHKEFKKVFVAIVQDYQLDPSDKKQEKMAKLTAECIKHDPQLLAWFNVMFHWRNTKFGLEVKFRIVPELPWHNNNIF
jgi:hypothetical protein